MSASAPLVRSREWLDPFSDEELRAVRTLLPASIQTSQVRSGESYDAYADPVEGKYVYGAGMLRGANKEARERLRSVSTYREQPIARSSRKSMHLGTKMIFVIRVGERMRTDITRLRLDSFSETRRAQLSEVSSTRQTHTSMFEVEDESKLRDDNATDADVVAHLQELGDKAELFVIYFSSDHHGVGEIYWAPARLEDRYLVFLNPERLTYIKEASGAIVTVGRPQATTTFANTVRPTTEVKRRKKSLPPTEIQ